MSYKILTQDEQCRLLLSFAAAKGDTGFTEEQAFEFIEACELTIVRSSLIKLAIDGEIYLDLKNGEFYARTADPGFKELLDGINLSEDEEE